MNSSESTDVVAIYLQELDDASSALAAALDLLSAAHPEAALAAEHVAFARQCVLHVQTLALPNLGAWLRAGQTAVDTLREIAATPAIDLACEEVTAAELVMRANGATRVLDRNDRLAWLTATPSRAWTEPSR